MSENKKLQGKVAVITGGTSGIGLAAAKLFVKEGAYVFITGRRQKELDDAVKAIGSNVTGVQGDIAKLTDLDRLYETVAIKGKIDIVFANAGVAEFAPLGKITEEHFDMLFGINVKGTLFTVQNELRNSGNITNHYLLVFSPSGFEEFVMATALPAPDNAVAPTERQLHAEDPAIAVQNVHRLATDYGIVFCD